MNFDTPPQALTICGGWNKILKIPGTSGRPRRTACLPARTLRGLGEQSAVQEMYPQKVKGNYADGKNKEVKLEIVGTVES